MQKRILVLVCIISGAYLAPTLLAQDTESWLGKRVVVVRETAELKAGNDVVGRARLGHVLLIDKANGPWLWIKNRRGWIKRSDVVLYDQAIEHFTAAITRNSTSQAYHHRATAYAAMGQYGKTVADLDKAIQIDQRNVGLYNERGNVLRRIGKLDRAIADFDEVIRRKVRHPAVYLNRGMVWSDKGDHDRALADFNSALGLDPKFAPAWEGGGSARLAKREYDKAIANFKRAIALDSKFDIAHNNLAWVLATCPDGQFRDGKLAVEHASKACKLTGFQDVGYLDTLAAAHAEAGQFDEAVKTANQAIEKAAGDKKDAIAGRLKLYEAGKSYQEITE